MRRAAFGWLEGEWLFKAGLYWEGKTDGHRSKMLGKLSGEWLYQALIEWPNVKQEDVISLLYEANNKDKVALLDCIKSMLHINKTEKG